MQEAVTQMPITPYEDPSLGYFTQHNQASMVSKLTNSNYVFAVNNMGSKSGHTTNLHTNQDSMNQLGIHADSIWIDSQEVNNVYFQMVISKGLEEGWVYEGDRDTFMCPCGKTEFLNTEENLIPNQSRTTYTVSEERICCNMCQQEAILANRSYLLMHLPETNLSNNISVYPEYADTELRHLVRILGNKEYLISRNSARDFIVKVNDTTYFLDPDITWMPFLHHLSSVKNIYVHTLFTGNRTLKQTALALLIGQMLNITLPSNIIATSRVEIDFGDKPFLKTRGFVANAGTDVSRIFLAQSTGARKKDILLKSSDAYWIANSIDQIHSLVMAHEPSGTKDPNYIMKNDNPQTIMRLMKKLRSGSAYEITEYERDLLWSILSKSIIL